MKIFIISCVFPPEPLTTAATSSDLADALVKNGHEVTVFAPFPNRPSGCLINGYSRKWRQIEHVKGYRIIHSWHTFSRKSSFFSRAAENITFGLSSMWQLYKEERPDVVYMNTWSFFSQGLNSWILKCRGVPIICSVQDIYPESLTEKGLVRKNGFVSRVIRCLDSLHLRRCASVTSISHRMAELLVKDRGLLAEKVHFIPNWMDPNQFPIDLPKNGPLRSSLGVSPEIFLAVFAGSLTMSAGADLYVQAAERLSQRKDIRILLAGDGSVREKLEQNIAFLGLNNIQIMHPLKQEEVSSVQAAADVLLLSFSGETLCSATPSKQISYMFSGRPTIASIHSKSVVAQIISEAHAGFVLPPGDSKAVADLLIKLSENRSLMRDLGDQARKYAEDNFSKCAILPRLVCLLESAAKTESKCRL